MRRRKIVADPERVVHYAAEVAIRDRQYGGSGLFYAVGALSARVRFAVDAVEAGDEAELARQLAAALAVVEATSRPAETGSGS